MKKAVIYTRATGRDKGVVEQRLEEQRQMCREYAAKHGYEIVGEYADTTSSGKKQRNFRRIVKKSKRGNFQFVIAPCMDRMTRRIRDYHERTEKLEKNGVEVVFANGISKSNLDWCFGKLRKEWRRWKKQ